MSDIDIIIKFRFADLEEEICVHWLINVIEHTKLLISFSRSGADRAVA